MYVNSMFGWNWFRSLRNKSSCPSPRVHKKNMSSIYQSQMNGHNCCVWRKLVSISSMRSVRWCKFSSNSCSWYLPANFLIEMISSVSKLQMPVSLSLFFWDREEYWNKAQPHLLLPVQHPQVFYLNTWFFKGSPQYLLYKTNHFA